MSYDTLELEDAARDLTSILQFFIRSGQVRVVNSDRHLLGNLDSEGDEPEDKFGSSSKRNKLDNSQRNINSSNEEKIKTQAIDKSDFKIHVLKDSYGFPFDPTVKPTSSHLLSMIRKRELGLCNQQCFNSTDKSLLGSRWIPNEQSVMETYEDKVFNGIYSEKGDFYLTSAHDGLIRIYDVENERFALKKVVSAKDVGWSVLDCVFSPDSRHFVYSSWSECLHICNIHGDEEVHETLLLAPANRRFCIFSLSYSNDGREIIGGACDKNIYIYDMEYKKRISQIYAHEDDINAVTFADKDSQILFSGGDDGLCKVWDRRTLNESHPKPVGVLAGHLDGITYIDPKYDGRHLISNSKDQTIKLWDIRVFSSKEGQEATKLAVSRQSWDYRFQLVPKKLNGINCRSTGDTSLMTYSGHTILQTLIRCHFSPSHSTGQRYIYTGCASGQVIIYDVLTGEIVKRLSGHHKCVRDVSWHPFRDELMSVSWDGKVIKWNYCAKRTEIEDMCVEFSSPEVSESEYFEHEYERALSNLRRRRRLRSRRNRNQNAS